MKEVRRLRLEKGWNQNELAFHADLAPSVISLVETGRREPNAMTLRKLADALGVDIPDLFERVDSPKAQAPPSPLPPEASGEQRRTLISLFGSWAYHADELRTKLASYLETLPTLADDKEKLKISTARIEEIVNDFYSMQEALNRLGVAERMKPYIPLTRSDREQIPDDDVYREANKLHTANSEIQRELLPRASSWVILGEETFEAFAGEPSKEELERESLKNQKALQEEERSVDRQVK